MAKAKSAGATPTVASDVTPATNGGTGSEQGEVVAKNKGGRRPGSGEDALYFNGERDKALTILVASHPGQYTSKQVAQALADHPAFADQRDLILTGTKHESFRQRLIKLNKRWTAMGNPELELRRLANVSYDVDAVLAEVSAQLYGSQGRPAASAPVAGMGGMVSGGTATGTVAAGGFTGGLIPTA